MIRFTRHSLYGTIIFVGILTAIVFVVEFGKQTMSAFGQKEGTLANFLLLGLIVSEVLTGFLPIGRKKHRYRTIYYEKHLCRSVTLYPRRGGIHWLFFKKSASAFPARTPRPTP